MGGTSLCDTKLKVTFFISIFIRFEPSSADLESLHLFETAKARQDGGDLAFDSDVNEGLIGQLFGQNLQTFPESTCQTEYMDILGGDMNDGRLPGQRTRSPKQCQKRCQDTKGCNFFAWDRYAGYCWLKRSDGLRIPHPKIIIGPKFCAGSGPVSVGPVSGSVSVPTPDISTAREPCAVTESQQQVTCPQSILIMNIHIITSH